MNAQDRRIIANVPAIISDHVETLFSNRSSAEKCFHIISTFNDLAIMSDQMETRLKKLIAIVSDSTHYTSYQAIVGDPTPHTSNPAIVSNHIETRLYNPTGVSSMGSWLNHEYNFGFEAHLSKYKSLKFI